MRGSSLGYLLKEGAASLWINRLMSAASIGVLSACLILVGAAGLFGLNINSIIGYVESQNEIVVFADDGLSDEDLEILDLEIRMLDNVSDSILVTSEDALQEQKEKLGAMGDLLDAYAGEESFLPASFRVQVTDISQMGETYEQLKGLNHVQKANAPTDMASTLTSIRQIVVVGGVSIVGILILVSLIIIANTIKITVFNRRKEINIMKYVGATDTFIRLPFIVEGFLLGLISAVVSYLLIWAGYLYVLDWMGTIQSVWIQEAYQYLIPFQKLSKWVLLAFGSIGMGVGVIGSSIFVGKYVKV